MLTIISIVAVTVVYAVLIGTFTGGEVTIGGSATGQVTYSTDQSTWTTTLSPASTSTSWYSKLNVDGGQYSGTTVEISWQLERKTTDTTWGSVGSPTTTTISLADGAQDVYATTDGSSTNNRDWGQDVSEQGTYRVVAVINSTP